MKTRRSAPSDYKAMFENRMSKMNEKFEPLRIAINFEMEDGYAGMEPYSRTYQYQTRRSFGATPIETRASSIIIMREILARVEEEVKAEIERRFYLAQGIDLDFIDSVLNGEPNTKQERDSL